MSSLEPSPLSRRPRWRCAAAGAARPPCPSVPRRPARAQSQTAWIRFTHAVTAARRWAWTRDRAESASVPAAGRRVCCPHAACLSHCRRRCRLADYASSHTHSLVDDAALATWCVCECRPAAASPARACARRAPALMMSTFLSFCDAERAFIGPDNRADTNIYTDGDDSCRQRPGGGASLARTTASRPSRLAHARRPVAADPQCRSALRRW